MSALTKPFSVAVRGVAKVADATTAAAGAVGGAAISGAVGGLRGAAAGVRSGMDSGSRSSAAAALTLGAVGAAGLVEWPVLVAVGGAALVVHQLNQRAAEQHRTVPAGTAEQRSTPSRPAAAAAKASAKPRKTAAARRSPSK